MHMGARWIFWRCVLRFRNVNHQRAGEITLDNCDSVAEIFNNEWLVTLGEAIEKIGN